mmetsp:Transcript_44465/g.128508  ORF Transcript_44465/g.128508 Transcript_44465/m.128508 type:complete len:485 (-) Transcript_44465:39-1493(-)
MLQSPLDAPNHTRAHGLHLGLDLLVQAIIDVPPQHNLALQWPGQLVFGCGALLQLGRRLDRMLDLPHSLQDLHTNSQRILLPVDHLPQEAKPLRPIRYPAVEYLFELGGLGTYVQLVHKIHTSACPQEDSAIASVLAFDGRVGVAEELQLQLQPMSASHVELGRKPTRMQARLGCRRRPDALGDIADHPIHAARWQVLDLRDSVMKLRRLLVQVAQAALCLRTELGHSVCRPAVDIVRVLLGRILRLLQEVVESVHLELQLVLQASITIVLIHINLLLLIHDALDLAGKQFLEFSVLRVRRLPHLLEARVDLSPLGHECLGSFARPAFHPGCELRLNAPYLLVDLIHNLEQLLAERFAHSAIHLVQVGRNLGDRSVNFLLGGREVRHDIRPDFLGATFCMHGGIFRNTIGRLFCGQSIGRCSLRHLGQLGEQLCAHIAGCFFAGLLGFRGFTLQRAASFSQVILCSIRRFFRHPPAVQDDPDLG